jgi:mono/diheme cytochrome c family protein
MPLFVFNSRFSIIDMMRTLLLSLLFIPFFLRAEEKVDFNTQIKSLLSNRCIACHGPDEEHREAGLRLDTFEGATRDIDGYSAIVPGNPEDSEILFRVTLEHGDQELMPPKGRGRD